MYNLKKELIIEDVLLCNDFTIIVFTNIGDYELVEHKLISRKGKKSISLNYRAYNKINEILAAQGW